MLNTNAHTFASRSKQPLKSKLARECAFQQPKEKFIFSQPSGVLIFFSNAQNVIWQDSAFNINRFVDRFVQMQIDLENILKKKVDLFLQIARLNISNHLLTLKRN